MGYKLDDFLKHTEELATISPAAVQLINKITSPDISRAEVVKLVSMDEVLFANVFKTVNSAAFGIPRKIQNLNEAIDILGINGVRNLVFAVAAKKVFVDLELWSKSIFAALAAQKIAKSLKLQPEIISDLYIAGLMQSMGLLIFKVFYKKDFEQVDDDLKEEERKQKEREVFGLTNEELSYQIIKDYELPESIVEIIKNQGKSWKEEGFVQVNAILSLAASLSKIDIDDIRDQEVVDEAIDRDMLKHFALGSVDIDLQFLLDLHEETVAFTAI